MKLSTFLSAALLRRTSLFLAALPLLTTGAWGFPPAPTYTLFGMVRDQVGQTVTAEGAVLVLLKGSVEIGRAPINSGATLDKNYQLPVRIDANRAGTTLYTKHAVPGEGAFSLAVEMNGSRYYPIEVSGNLRTGKGGELLRLDLNLGGDADGDGIPDIWEQWQLYQAGYFPDANGNWPIHLLSRTGDLDKDGQSDWLEYVAGTFAGDATDRLVLDIKEKTSTGVRFEFFAITGKTYTIERSTDMKTWSLLPFSIAAPATGSTSYTAKDVRILSAYAQPDSGTNEFYRLTVR
jgi:hypothetical protein